MGAKSLQLCPTLCDPMDCSLPVSSVHGILQARIPEWIAISFSRGSSQPRDLMSPALAGRFFTTTATGEALPLHVSLTQLQACWPHCFWNMPRTSSRSEYLPETPPRELTAHLSPPSVLYAKVTFSGHLSSACNPLSSSPCPAPHTALATI